MRQIKFRGHFPGDTRYFYGGLKFDAEGRPFIVTVNGSIQVDPESVKQLVYIGADGTEYYEGDEMVKNGRKWRCELCMRWNEAVTVSPSK